MISIWQLDLARRDTRRYRRKSILPGRDRYRHRDVIVIQAIGGLSVGLNVVYLALDLLKAILIFPDLADDIGPVSRI